MQFSLPLRVVIFDELTGCGEKFGGSVKAFGIRRDRHPELFKQGIENRERRS